MPLRAGELEYLFTADTKQVEQAEKTVKTVAKRIEGNPATVKVDADGKPALASMDRVEGEARRLAGDSFVTKVDADTSAASAALDGIADEAADAGAEGGEQAGAGLADGIVGALQALPIAGAVVLAGVAIGRAVFDGFQDGLQVEVRQDRLQALTGITEEDARRFAMAAGEAYADVFGESIEQNMDTARLALQFDLLDEDSTAREAEDVIKSLAGIADVLGEDVQPIAQAVTTMLRSGIVASAEEAFDVLAAGARNGVNVADDLLDTFIEYPALFSRLGLSADEALGLLNQGLEGGARNSDLVADALKEFQIRATDASDASAEGFRTLGLDAEEMTAKIARGGEDAREGLEEVLTALNEIEDPVARNAAAVALFGTQAEDLGGALFALDLSTAVDELDGVTGAAQQMFDTLSDNDATALEEARRNIEVAADGIKGALAAAFADPLEEAADWVSANRGPILEFFSGLVNGAIDFGVSALEGTAAATQGFGDFVSGPLAEAVEGIANLLAGLNPLRGALGVFGIELGQTDLQALADDMRGFSDTTDEASESILGLIPGLEDARGRFNEFMDPQVASGYLHDATLRLAGAVAQVGYEADGSTELVDAWTASQDGAVTAGSALEDQIEAAVAAMQEETAAAIAAGEGQEDLTARWNLGRDALVDQLVQMGLTQEQAESLADAYGAVPTDVETDFSANTADAQADVDEFVAANSGKRIVVKVGVASDGSQVYSTAPGNPLVATFQRDGGMVMPMAAGGALSPMAKVAQRVPPNTWRVVGDRVTDDEFFIPADGSARSRAILMEALRHPSFNITQMASGGALSSRDGRGGDSADYADYLIRGIGDHILQAMRASGGAARMVSRAYSDSLVEGVAVVRR